MATLIPEKSEAHTTPAVARLFRILKKLPDDYLVWHQFNPTQPHFLILAPGPRAFLIHVAETSEELAQSALQLQLLESSTPVTPDTLAEAELTLLSAFPIAPGTPIRRLLIFPNASQGTLDQVVLQRSESSDVHFLGLRQSSPDDFLTTLEKLACAPLSQSTLYTLRATFTPESVIPLAHRPTLIERERASDSPPTFLDLDQEKLFKQDLLQAPPGEEITTSSRLVTGPAGSGKSLILLHRALLAARLHQGARLLILTHNKPIGTQLKERFHQLAPSQSTVRWSTFFSWAISHLRPQERIISDHETRRRITSQQAHNPALSDHQPDFLTDEINYLRDLGIASLKDYLALKRTGRLTALHDSAREAIWQLLTTYRDQLTREKLLDWQEVALLFYDKSRTQPKSLQPAFDFIFIDEAQFFAKVWFAPILASLKPSGQLFLSADQTQGFLKRRQSWRDLGIDVIGRSHRLARVYRSTRQIAAAANHFFKSRTPAIQENSPEESPDLLQPEDLATLPDGEAIHLFTVASRSQALQKATELVQRQLARTQHLREHILVIEADSSKASALTESLQSHLGPDTVRNMQAKHGDLPPKSPLCLATSLHAATGLEATSVIVLGLDSLLEKENDPTLSREDHAELRAVHTSLIYVALTRAVCRLAIVTQCPDEWRKLLGLTKPRP